jgi:hypothetical protein
MRLSRLISFAYIYEGRFSEANAWLQRGLEWSRTQGMPADRPQQFHAL